MKQIAIYLAVFLLTLYCFFLYDDEIVTVMLVVEVAYFFISVLWLQLLQKKIEVSMNSLIPIAEKNQNIPIKILIRNRSKIFSVHVKVKLVIENTFTGEKQKICEKGKAVANRTESFVIDLKVNTCGNFAITLKEYWIYDLLFILSKKKKGKEVQNIGILPECHLIPIEVTRGTREFIAEADEYSDRESGDDPSEIYQVREYREQDSLRDVHWKLSAKADDLLVKEHGRPKGSVVLIWMDMQADMRKQKNIPSVILEAVASLSMSLLEAECVHMVAWYEKENQKIQKKRIGKEDHIYELLNRLLYTKVYKEDVQEQYEEAFRGISFSSIVKIDSKGNIFINEEEKMALSLKEDQNKWDELYFIV